MNAAKPNEVNIDSENYDVSGPAQLISGLADEEWDFSSIKKSADLAACCFWELCRELPFLQTECESKDAKRQLSIDQLMFPSSQRMDSKKRELNGVLHGIPYRIVQEAFHADEYPLPPWQLLGRTIRHQCIGVSRKYKKSRSPTSSHVFPPLLEQRKSLSEFDGSHLEEMALTIGYYHVFEDGRNFENDTPLHRIKLLLKHKLITRHSFLINWTEHSPQQIISHFKKWLKKASPKNAMQNRGKGRKGNCKQWLTWISAKRLLRQGYSEMAELPAAARAKLQDFGASNQNFNKLAAQADTLIQDYVIPLRYHSKPSKSSIARRQIIMARKNGQGSAAIARDFRKSRRTIDRYWKQHQNHATLPLKRHGGHRRSKLVDHKAILTQWLEQDSSMTLDQIRCRCQTELHVSMSIHAIWHFLRQSGLYRLKMDARKE